MTYPCYRILNVIIIENYQWSKIAWLEISLVNSVYLSIHYSFKYFIILNISLKLMT